MKKPVKILLVVLAVLIVLAGAGAFVLMRLDAQAKEHHTALAYAITAR